MKKKEKDAFEVWKEWWALSTDWHCDPVSYEAWDGAVDTICEGLSNLILTLVDENLSLDRLEALKEDIRKRYKSLK